MFAVGIGNLARHAFYALPTSLAKLNACLLSSPLPASEHAWTCLRPSKLNSQLQSMATLFCIAQKVNLFTFISLRTLSQKHPGLLFCSPPTSNLFPFISFRTLSQKTPGVGGRAKVHGSHGPPFCWAGGKKPWSFRGNTFRITSLYDSTNELPWNHILTKNIGGGGARSLRLASFGF
jgi:hypothetical protein